MAGDIVDLDACRCDWPDRLNAGKAWSEMDLDDLKSCAVSETTLAKAADFLMRSKEEVAAKATELGLRFG